MKHLNGNRLSYHTRRPSGDNNGRQERVPCGKGSVVGHELRESLLRDDLLGHSHIGPVRIIPMIVEGAQYSKVNMLGVWVRTEPVEPVHE